MELSSGSSSFFDWRDEPEDGFFMGRACQEDIAFRLITASHYPDHAAIALFRQEHSDLLNSLFALGAGFKPALYTTKKKMLSTVPTSEETSSLLSTGTLQPSGPLAAVQGAAVPHLITLGKSPGSDKGGNGGEKEVAVWHDSEGK